MFCSHGILLLEVEGTGRNKSTLFDKLKNKCSMWNIKKRMIKMCKFAKVEKMLIENGIKNYGICHGAMEIQTPIYYIYMEKVSNGILVKVRYNEMTTYFTNMIVKNQNQALGLIEGRILETQEEQKEIKEVNVVEILKTIGNLIKEMHIERTTNGLTQKWYELKALKEELNNKARSIIDDNYKDILKEETQEETQETQEEETITFLNNEGHVTSAVIVSKDNPYLREQCNHDLIQTTDGKYWELWTTYNGYLVAIDTDEYDQTETQAGFDFDNNCEYCGTIHNVEFRQTTLLGKYAFVCEHCLKNLNTETQETSYNYGKDSVDAQSVSRSEYCEKLKPFTNYVQDMARYHRHDYNELIKTEYNTTKKAIELFTVGELAFIPNTLDGKKEYLKGMLDTTKKDIKNLVLNNDESDYEALDLFYRLHIQLESTKGLLNELCGFKNEMILR